MSQFDLARVPSIYSGAGRITELPTQLQSLGCEGTVLLIMDPGLKAAGLLESIPRLLRQAEIPLHLAVLPVGEPKESFIRTTLAEFAAAKPAAVVCIGGGSALDAGKLIACLSLHGDDVSAYRLATQPLPSSRPPLICIPTTSGTGAEATRVAVIGQDNGIKNWFWGDELKPDMILLDPELTVGLPAAVTAATGMDAMVHAIEAASNKNSTQANNVYCYRAIELVCQHLAQAVAAPADLEARSGMQEAATLAGIGIDNCGTALAHNIAHALGSLANIPHGQAVAMGMCASLSWSLEGQAAAYQGVAQAMGLSSVEPLAATFLQHCLAVGIILDLSQQAPQLSADALAEQMQKPENIAMAEASLRPLAPADFLSIAERVLKLPAAASLSIAI